MIFPILLAVGIWSYNIVKIAGRMSQNKSEETGKGDEAGKVDEAGMNISNSAEAISHILNSEKNNTFPLSKGRGIQ